MSRFDKAIQSLQPSVKDIVRTFLLDTNFGEENRRALLINFTTPADEQLGFRRLELNTYKDGRVPGLYHDTNIVEYKKMPPYIPLIKTPEGEVVKQTLENVMNLIDSVTIKHIHSVYMRKYYCYSESNIIYDWRDVADLAKEASRDKTTHYIK
jgi:hypothetical protein